MVARRLVRLVRQGSRSTQDTLDGRPAQVAVVATLLALAAVAVGVAVGTPRAGARGAGLGVSLATAAVMVAGLALVAGRARTVVAAVAALVLGLASAALAGLDPDSPGYVGAFIAVGALGLRIGGRTGARAAAVVVGAVTAAFALSRNPPQPPAILSVDLGMVTVYAVATFAREQQRLLAQVREAQEARAQAAALQERARLAREIHDVLAHSLTGLSVQLEGARLLLLRLPTDPAAVAQVERAQALARTGLDEARRAVGALRGDAMPGPELLPTLAADFERDTGVPCRLAVEGDPVPLAAESRLAIYRTAQEALSNVRKHAAAAEVTIGLRWQDGAADLVVTDRSGDGGASRPLATTGGGYGLAGIRERAELLGGTLEAGATASGFAVHLRLPA